MSWKVQVSPWLSFLVASYYTYWFGNHHLPEEAGIFRGGFSLLILWLLVLLGGKQETNMGELTKSLFWPHLSLIWSIFFIVFMLNLDEKGVKSSFFGLLCVYWVVFLIFRGRCQKAKEITSFDEKESFGDEFWKGKEVLRSAEGMESKSEEPKRVYD